MITRFGSRLRGCARAWLAAACVPLLASDASGFCRQTETPQPTPLECPAGIPLVWAASCVSIRLAPTMLPPGWTPDQAQTQIERAASAWAAPRCDGGGAAAFRVLVDPPEPVTVGYFPGRANTNTVSFETRWPRDGRHPFGAAAITIISTDQLTHQIVDADIEINLTDVSGPVTEAYVRGLITHELGHFQGLAHTPRMDAVMYPLLQNPPALALTPDDAAGLCAAYPPDRAVACDPALRVLQLEGGGLQCATAPGRRRTAGLAIAATLGLALGRRRRLP